MNDAELAQGYEEVVLSTTPVAVTETWVKVSEGHPAQTGMYLCYHPEHGQDVIFFSGKKWGKTSFWNWEDPTHWMNLPEDPNDV